MSAELATTARRRRGASASTAVGRDGRLVPLLRRASPATWRSAACSTPAPTSPRCSRSCDRLPLGGWSLRAEPVLRAGIAATRAVVETTDDVVVRTHAHIVGLVEEARLPDRVTRRALATFAALAEVEGRLHRRPPEQVHFHEVGSHDTVIDVVGTAAALEVLGDRRGDGVAGGHRHGHGPQRPRVPAQPVAGRGPAAAAGSRRGVGTSPSSSPRRPVRPSWRPWRRASGRCPPCAIAATGFGAGSTRDRRPPQLHPGRGGRVHWSRRAAQGQPVMLLETNLDDATGEVLAHAVEALLDAGRPRRLDHPGRHEEGPARPHRERPRRPGPDRVGARHARRPRRGASGCAVPLLERWPAARVMDEVDVEGAPVRVKVSPGRVKVEQRDAARVAAAPTGFRCGRCCTAPRRCGVDATRTDRRRPTRRPPAEGPTSA